ncbi:hypothetical protein PsYK624_129550 [Phanerochaete sordida]|uniref:Uncharacterized protein n=1 Tax=Phanerochaete sordida TaxID=48140 RepID=A0A9P3GM39_9APHY|nr:hypothetical protein PsYK624_129550 [Phanerochaete sordida]
MCYGENNATHAASYFNTQLYGLWKVADECANHYLGEDRQDLKPDERPHRYTFALAAWHYGRHRQGYAASVDDMMFYASFQVPELSFICNHEAEFRIRVADESDDVEPYYGHFNLDSHRASESATAELSRNQSLKPGTTFVFRVPFRTTDFQGNAALIGNGNHVLSWLVLDYRRAKLAKIEPSVDQPSFQALEIYLRAYLSFLQAAGHHVFLSLPSFSDAEGGVDIHYSEVITHQSRLQEVHGVAITDINKYLSTAWLKAAMLASGPEGQIYDRPGISLAEYQSTWLSQRSDVHFHFTFGPPEVSVLCNDEVVVNFVIDEASFYQSDNFEGSSLRTYMNWKVAVVFDLDYEEPPEEGGNVRRCKIRMAGARLVVGCSTFEGLDMNDDISLHCRYRTAEFISGEYLSILESGGYNLIFEHDRRWAAQGDEFEQAEDPTFANDSTWSAADTVEDASGKITKAAIWHNIIQQSDMYGYEQLTALSETAINQNFHSLAGQNDMLQEWTFEDFFSVTFKPPTVRLRSDGRALITFHLKDGFVRALKNRKPHPQGEKKDFTNWRVTFEVGLGICDHDAVPGITTPWQSVSMLEQSRVRQDIGPDSGATLKHLYLDLRLVF